MSVKTCCHLWQSMADHLIKILYNNGFCLHKSNTSSVKEFTAAFENAIKYLVLWTADIGQQHWS